MFARNEKFEVLSRHGFSSFSGVRRISRLGRVEMLLENGDMLKCTDNHRLMTDAGWVVASSIRTGTKILCKSGDHVSVFDVQYSPGVYEYYDLVDVDGDHEYYTNNLLSHNCEFLGSSNTLISPSKLRMLTYVDPIVTKGDVKIYENVVVRNLKATPPEPGRLYMMVADTSRGVDGDYSAFVVFDVTEFPYKVVATYRNNEISTQLYPSYIMQAAQHYNNAMVLVETNDIGGQVADILHQDLEYENVFFTASSKKTGQYITMGFSTGSVRGVRTSATVKRVGCSTLKTLIEYDKLIINDFDLLEELSRFSQKGNSYEAEEGHDDLVMCCVLFSWLTTQQYFKEITRNDIRQKLYKEQQEIIDEELTPFGVIDFGDDGDDEVVMAVHNDDWLLNDRDKSANL